jgi:hypothetical protein
MYEYGSRVLLKHGIEAIVVAGAMLCLTLVALAQGPEIFSARLTMMPIDETMRAQVTGSGSGSAVLEGVRLIVTGSFSGLQGPATAAQLHQGLATGIRGTALFELTVAASADGDFRGEIELTHDQVQSLQEGRLYIQIYSETAPEGNLWGWLLPQEPVRE